MSAKPTTKGFIRGAKRGSVFQDGCIWGYCGVLQFLKSLKNWRLGGVLISKNANVKRSVSFTADTLKKLDAMSAKRGVSTSQLVREFVDAGMRIEKTKDDIGFIRKQIREELEMAFEARMSRIIKLLIKQGAMIYPMAYYNAMMGAAMSKRNNIDFHKMIEEGKKKGAKYLGVVSEVVDLAFEEIMNIITE